MMRTIDFEIDLIKIVNLLTSLFQNSVCSVSRSILLLIETCVISSKYERIRTGKTLDAKVDATNVDFFLLTSSSHLSFCVNKKHRKNHLHKSK